MDNVNKILCTVFKISKDKLNDNLTMKEIDRWDSLTHMELVASLEEGLKIQFSMNDILSMKSVREIRNIVVKLLESK